MYQKSVMTNIQNIDIVPEKTFYLVFPCTFIFIFILLSSPHLTCTHP